MIAKLILSALLFLPTIASITNFSKLIVIADLHADVHRFKAILRDAKILDVNNKWIAPPETVIVQLGDQIDPKEPDTNDINDRHHFKMIYLTDHLEKMAKVNNCEFISMIGNHELYNIDAIRKKDGLCDIIANRPIILKRNNLLFCHGGFRKRHYYLLDIYNKSIQNINEIWSKYVYGFHLTLDEEILLNNMILDRNDSVLFTRVPDNKVDIDRLFTIMDIDYMFVGHTTYKYVHLQHKIWYLDLYLKDAFDNKAYQYLVIDNEANITVKQLSSY